jgi:hypothetical protein
MRGFFRGIERVMAKLNRWLAPAAMVDATLQSGTPQQADATHVTAILSELELTAGAQRRSATEESQCGVDSDEAEGKETRGVAATPQRRRGVRR